MGTGLSAGVVVSVMTLFRWLAVLAFLCCFNATFSVANVLAEHRWAGANVKRDVLAVYDGEEEKSPDQTRIHKFLEMPLNHLGYRITYWDLKRGMPSGEVTLRHAAVVSWFSGKVSNAADYFHWAAWAARMKLRFVLFGAVGADGTADEVRSINSFFNELSLEFVSHYVSATRLSQVVTKDARVVDFERKIPAPLPGYLVVRPMNLSVRALLAVQDPAIKRFGPEPTVLVATSPAGGYAAANYAVDYDQKRGRLAWLIDPIAFLTGALATDPMPVADTTTRAGRRMYFSHIDGDGWNNTSASNAPASGPHPIAAETVYKELIDPFPDLPVSVGLISCDIDLARGATSRSIDIARKYYSLPQVEVASHTHTHPFDWNFFEKYSRSRELERINPPAPKPVPARVAQTAKSSAGFFDFFGPAASPAARPVAPSVVPQVPVLPSPRYKTDKPFDLSLEVAGSLQVATELAPEGKRAKLYLWSGDTRPFEAAVRATRQAGVRNMNGGDTRYDSDFASLAYVRPLSRLVGRERQIFAPNANEMIYTNDWKGPYNGFAKLRETFERTDRPRRLKPANLYYHMFSADQPAGLEAVRAHLTWARSQPVIPVAASQYAAIADDFFAVEFQRLGPQIWRVTKRGELQTVRFDNAADRAPDYAASIGVLGHNHHNGSLYIALDRAAGEPVVALQANGAASRAHLVESRWDVRDLAVSECSVDFKAGGYGRGEMRWGGLKPGAWQIKVSRDGKALAAVDVSVDASGIMDATIDADARAGAAIEMRCAG